MNLAAKLNFYYKNSSPQMFVVYFDQQTGAPFAVRWEVFQLQLKNVARWSSEHCKTAMGKSIIIEFRATNTDYRINEYELSI